jgi:polysaccharide biosynthesis transport protein
MNSVVSALTQQSPEPSARRKPAKTNISGLWTILAQRLPSIAAITLASLALSALYVALATPTYTSSATLIIDPRLKKIVTEDTSQNNNGPDLALIESQVAIIRSDAVLSRAVESMKLADDVEFAPPAGNGIGSKIKAALGMKTAPVEPATQALATLAQHVTVKRASKTYVVEIEATSNSPVKAARLTQAIVDAYLADQTGAKTGEAQRANAMIDSRLGELREQVRRAETRVDEFRKANRILTSEGGTVGEQQLTRLNSELINARTQATEAKARLDEVTAAARSGDTDVITDPAKTGLVQRLREQLAQVARREASLASQLLPRHPVLIDIHSQMVEIKSQISAELKRLAANAKADYQVAASRERELSKALDATKEEVGRTNTAQIKQRELDQEVVASRELMRVFLARSKETDEQQKLSTPDARMISPPSVPSRPSKPVPALILALGLLGGLALGIGRALTMDHFDRSLKTSAEVENLTGLRTLAIIPALPARPRNAPPARPRGAPTVIEASRFGNLARALTNTQGPAEFDYRRATMSVLNRIRMNASANAPHSVLFAGPFATSGSTATAFSIAYAAACLGDRVLLIDAASANTMLSDALIDKLPVQGPIALDNEDDLASIITHDPRSGLAFLPIGMADLRSLKTAQRKRLQAGLEQLSKLYDLVVIDGGGVLEDESAHIILPLAKEVILIAESGETQAATLTAVSQQLDRARDKITGVVLTGSYSPPA